MTDYMSCVDLEKERMLFSEILINSQKNLTSGLIRNIDEEISKHNNLIDSMSGDEKDTYLDDFLDNTEYLVGLGFAVIQQYMTVIYGRLGKEKDYALRKGPRHKSGQTFAKIINCSANYWKHHNEWNLQKESRNEKSSDEFFKIVLSSREPYYMHYRLQNTLREISSTECLSDVLCVVDEWKTCLTA